jgi:hypothetical protein
VPSHFGKRLYQSSADALVAAVSPAAPGAQAAQLIQGFVEQYMVFGHGVS